MPEYTLRYSKKAKYLQLRLSIHGLEVVIPANTLISPLIIEQFIQQKQPWIERKKERCSFQAKNALQLPTSIHLQAIEQSWEVIYLATPQQRLKLNANACKQLKLVGHTSNQTLCIRLLKQWLKSMAQQHLTKELLLISEKTGLGFKGITIRNTKTRWGSCSSQQKINLCCKLLFLPPILMRHVLLHELCHTKFMHHGKAFWDLLERFDSSAKIHARQLKLAVRDIPLWANG